MPTCRRGRRLFSACVLPVGRGGRLFSAYDLPVGRGRRLFSACGLPVGGLRWFLLTALRMAA